MSTALPTDAVFLDVACDVAIRFKGHDSYGSEAGAAKAFARRAPGFEPSVYRDTLATFLSLYDRAVDAIGRHQSPGPSGYARPEDIDFEACIIELDQLAPHVGPKEKECILHWVIFWHYLK